MTMEDPPQNPPGEGLVNQQQLPTVQVSNIPAQAASVAGSATTLRNESGAVRSETKNPAKIAIPRQRAGIAPRYNRRVPRACESCRARKTKCSGDTPVCRQCRELRVTCNYPVGWKERTKK